MIMSIVFLFVLTWVGLAIIAARLLGLDLSRFDTPIVPAHGIGWISVAVPAVTATTGSAALIMLSSQKPLYEPAVWAPALLLGAAAGLVYYAVARALAADQTLPPHGVATHPRSETDPVLTAPRTYSSYTRMGLVSYTFQPTTVGKYPLQLAGTTCYGTPQALDMLLRLVSTARDLRGDEPFEPEDDYQRGQIEMIANTIHSLDGDGDACRYFVQWLVAGPEGSDQI